MCVDIDSGWFKAFKEMDQAEELHRQVLIDFCRKREVIQAQNPTTSELEIRSMAWTGLINEELEKQGIY
jgi:hypothetical protein